MIHRSFCSRIKPELMNRTRSTGRVKEIRSSCCKCSELEVRSCFCSSAVESHRDDVCFVWFRFYWSNILTENQTKQKVQRYFLLILEFCPVQLCLVWARSWTSVVTCWSNAWSLDGRCWFLISNLSVSSDKRSFLTWSNWLFWFF